MPNRRLKRLTIASLVIAGLFLVFGTEPRPASSAAPALSLGKTTVSEGDDYATRVLDSPWWNLNGAPYPDDFTALKNINEDTFTVTPDGFWRMTSTSDDTNIWLSWPGLDLTQEVLDMGVHNPIDTGKYRLVSYYLCLDKAPASTNTNWASIIYWFYDRMPFADFRTSKFQFFVQQGLFKQNGDCELLTIDLSRPESWMDPNKPWNNSPQQPIGFRLDPINVKSMGFSVGWVRLTTRDTTNIVPLTWSGVPSGENSFFVSRTGCGQKGVLVGKKSGSSGTFNWGAQVIPGFSVVHPLPLPESFEPDEYYLYMKDSTGAIVCGANNPLTIQAAPTLDFQKPSFLSGPDFATETFGNPWGMASGIDVSRLENVSDFWFEDGILSMTSDDDDPQVYLNLYGGTIPTDDYRYASFRFRINGQHNYKSDWVQRWIWWYTGGPFVDNVTTQDMELYEGWHVYTIDLETALTENCARNCWSGTPRVFRFDPFETPKPTTIQLDYVLLTGPEVVAKGALFRIAFTTTAPQNASIRFYYDTDTNPANGRTLIGEYGANRPDSPLAAEADYRIFVPFTQNPDRNEIPLYSGSSFYYWNTSNAPLGTYYISAVVDDGLTPTTWYSEQVVTIK